MAAAHLFSGSRRLGFRRVIVPGGWRFMAGGRFGKQLWDLLLYVKQCARRCRGMLSDGLCLREKQRHVKR